MKNLFLSMLVFVGVTTFAQEKLQSNVGEGKKTPEQKAENQAKRTEFEIKKLTEDLGLNEKQAGAVKELMESEAKKREANKFEMKDLKTENVEEMRAKFKKEKEFVDEQMKNILTADQYAKWKKIQEERVEKMKEKMKERSEKKAAETQKEVK